MKKKEGIVNKASFLFATIINDYAVNAEIKKNIKVKRLEREGT